MSQIKHQFATGSFWLIVGRGSSNIASFLVFALLARFLGPDNFGIVAFAVVFIDLTRAIAFAGLPQALIQTTEWDEKIASTAFWTNIGFATLLVLLLSGAFKPVMVAVYDPRLAYIIPVLSATLIIDAARVPHEALLQRRLSYKAFAKRTLLGTIVGGGVGVALAWLGWGVWALVISRVVTSLTQTAVMWTAIRWRPQMAFNLAGIKPLLVFGAHIGGGTLLNQINVRTADFVIGIFLGPTAVGFFRIGSRATTIINDAVILPMNNTALAAFSRVQSKEGIARAYLRVTKACALVSLPAYFGAAVVAPDFVELCFGAEWRVSGEVMAMLSLFGGAAIISFFSTAALAAVGESFLVLLINIMDLVSNIIFALIAVHWGVVAMGLAYSVRTYVTLPFVFWTLKRGLDLSAREVIKGVMAPFLAAAVMAASVLLLREQVLSEVGPLIRLLLMVFTGAVVYGVALIIFGRSYLREMKSEIAPILGRLVGKGRG